MNEKGLVGQSVVVTGAGGFIGRALVRGLIGEGAHVTAVLRNRHGADALRRMGARVTVAPLAAGNRLVAALQGNACLFNFAYDMRAGGAENLHAFDALLAAAAKASIRRIIHASSVVVYDDWPNGVLTEVSPVSTTTGGAYRQTKIAMERRLLASAFEVALLQPTIVYGSGSPQWTNGPIAALRAGGVILPDPPGLCAAVHVEDVVQATMLAAVVPGLMRERFLICGSGRLTWAEFYQGYAALVGGKVVLEPLAHLQARVGLPSPPGPDHDPSVAARISSRLRLVVGNQRFEAATARLRGLRGAKGPASPDPYGLILFAARPEVSIHHATDRLGYRPKLTFSDGLASIAAQL